MSRRLTCSRAARLAALAVAIAALHFLLAEFVPVHPRRPRRGVHLGLASPAPPAQPSSEPTVPAVFVMADSRPIGTSLASASYLTLAAVLNYAYAKQQRYEFRFFRLPPRDGSQCTHPTLKEDRGASWCKLLAAWRVASTTTASRVVLLDSDCAIVAQGTRLEDWLARNATDLRHHGPPPLDADLVLLSDHYADVPCDTWCELDV